MQKILVVDDEPWIQQLVEAMLEPLGVEVHVASDGVQGLELSRLHAYDLIISDVEMPRMDGFQMIDQLRREGCDAAIILFTGKATLQQALDARERYGIAGFISKPIVGRDQFLYQVQTALRTRQLERTRERPAASAPGPPAEPGAAAPEATPAAQFDVFRNSVLQVLAHELRTPLAIVKGYLPLIADGARGDASAAPEPMRRAIDRLQQIVDRALALLARPTPGPAAAAVVPVRPAALCERVAARLRPLAARREVEIECAPGEALPECRWDAEKIDAVLEELLINAIRAT
ncbi:MAG: hybrid sensor histidine kinase/response regulator, partial [Candidatus Lambdaproteobacteria bacterium]|nr:hybrid sensor histidine kinase/response regulator [Candidatus Lambdaproteobacteria bacterium]